MSTSMIEQSALKMRTPRQTNGCLKNSVNSSLGEEVRTLFVSGLPMDVRLRELYLLFRNYDGYEGAFLKPISSKPGKPPQPIAFVSFDTRKQAEKALDELQGVHFDPASAQTLRLEFARTNSRISPKQQCHAPQQTMNVTNSSMNVTNSSQSLPPQSRNGQYGSTQNAHGSTQLTQGSTQLTQGSGSYGHTSSPNMLTLADCWAPSRMLNNMSPVSYSSGTTTLSPASSTAHLSVLSILSDSDSSAYPTPASTPDIEDQDSSSNRDIQYAKQDSSTECSIPACSSEPIPPQQQSFHHQQSSVQMLPRLNGDNSVVMQGCGRSSNLQYPTAASNLKQFVSNTPLYVYQTPMFMNQQMPMWQ